MYKHYETSDEVFVDREEHIEWMNEALERCKKRSVVLHLKGIGGIGKSSLLNHWMKSHEKTIRLDCEQYTEFYQRLNILAKGAVIQGIKLKRFDILWQMRQRFVEGVEPVREEGREWAKEVVMAIPFIGSLASIGSAISAVSAKVTPKLKGKYGTIGKWLQENLGKEYIEQLLEILWKDPRRAEFLYLSAFLDDINKRDDIGIPIVFLIDHFEYVDNINAQWKYQKQKIHETQLWTLFLSNLSNCVGVLASRRSASGSETIKIEERELMELERESCLELMDLQGVKDETLQQTIVSVSGGNPFVIDAICDMVNTSDVTRADIENLRADTLSDVRLKVWRKLFREAEGLQQLINRAGILPYFDEQIMRIVAPEMNPDDWDRLKKLSFVNMRSDGTFVLHDLAEDLVKAELGENLQSLAMNTSQPLEDFFKNHGDPKILGLAFSVQALGDQSATLKRIDTIINQFLFDNDYLGAHEFLDSFFTDSDEGYVFRESWRGYIYQLANRITDAEDLHSKVLVVSEKLHAEKPNQSAQYLARAYWFLARFYQDTSQWHEAEQAFRKTLEILNNFEPQDEEGFGAKEDYLTGTYHYLGLQLSLMYHLKEAEEFIRKAILIYEKPGRMPHYFSDAFKSKSQPMLLFAKNILAQVFYQSGRTSEAEAVLREILDLTEESVITNMTLFRLAITLGFQHRWNEVLEIRRIILKNYEKLTSKDPDFQYSVTESMGFLCLPLIKTGQHLEAEKIFNRVIPEYQRLVENNKPFAESLTVLLQNSVIFLGLTGKLRRARDACLESIEIFRELAERYPDRYTHRLAAGISNLSIVLLQIGDTKEAQKTMEEAYETAKEISLKHQEATSLAMVYAQVTSNIGAFYEENAKWNDAQRFLDEAHDIVNHRLEIASEMFLPLLAAVDNNSGILYCEKIRFSDSETRFKDALEIRRNYVKRAENFFLPKVALVLNNLGILYRRNGQVDQAEKMYREAIDIMEPFAEKAPKVHSSDMARILNNMLVLFEETKNSHSANLTRAKLRRLGAKETHTEEQWFIDIAYLEGY